MDFVHKFNDDTTVNEMISFKNIVEKMFARNMQHIELVLDTENKTMRTIINPAILESFSPIDNKAFIDWINKKI
jgi:hypothetical protein